MTVRWITETLGTAPALAVIGANAFDVIDVRDLVDKSGNRADTVRTKIDQGLASLRAGNKVVVCCDYGISRSNAIAAGILALHQNVPFETAVRKVQEATGETEIKLEPLSSVRQALGIDPRSRATDSKRVVAVTGSSGTIGMLLLPELKKQFEVISPNRQELNLADGATQLDLLMADHAVDCLIHLANPRVYTSNTAMGSTLAMLRNVMDVCISRNIRLIYPSGWEIYSAYRGSLIADESLPAHPKGPYGETKYLAEILVDLNIKSRGLRCTLLRSSPLYGSTSSKPKFIYNFIDKAKRGDDIVTHWYRNGAPSLDLMNIRDFVTAIILAIQHNDEGCFNVGTGILTSTSDIAKRLVDMLGSQSRIRHVQIESHAASIAMDYSKASSFWGWQPKISLEQGLQDLALCFGGSL